MVEEKNEVYLRLYLSLFRAGLVAALGANNFTTLLTIASFMNEKGECYPTQKQIAQRMGVHYNSVNRYIRELLDFRYNGQPIITREKIGRKYGGYSTLYRIHPVSQLAIFNGKVDNLESQKIKERVKKSEEKINRILGGDD